MLLIEKERNRVVLRNNVSVCALALLTACSSPDYTAVRDWAGTASLVSDYSLVAKALPAASRTGLPIVDQDAEQRLQLGDSVLAMQMALSTYLSALGTVAADGVLPFREDPFVQLAARAAMIDETGGRAVAALGVLLRTASRGNAQAPEMRETIVAADASVQALVAALSGAVARLTESEAHDRTAVRGFYARLESQARDPVARQSARDWGALREQAFATRAAARADYGIVLTRIGDGHALLKARAPHITQEESIRQIRAAEDLLRRTAASLPQGMASHSVLPEGDAHMDAVPAKLMANLRQWALLNNLPAGRLG